MPTENLYHGGQNFGGAQKKRDGALFTILSKDFTGAEQATPIRVIYGKDKVTGTHIFPVFGFRAEAITISVGK